jgi:hypothetical protein
LSFDQANAGATEEQFAGGHQPYDATANYENIGYHFRCSFSLKV